MLGAAACGADPRAGDRRPDTSQATATKAAMTSAAAMFFAVV